MVGAVTQPDSVISMLDVVTNMNLLLGTAFEGTFWSLSYVRLAVLSFIMYVINDHSLQTVISHAPPASKPGPGPGQTLRNQQQPSVAKEDAKHDMHMKTIQPTVNLRQPTLQTMDSSRR